MKLNNYELKILVKGRPVTEYIHDDQTFIEGRDGSNFEIEFLNNTSASVEAVISVDGLSILDGKLAGSESHGYVVAAYGRIKIPGWKLTDKQAASFVFSGKKNSYSTQTTGTAVNNGVIGVLVYKQKTIQLPPIQYIPSQPYYPSYPLPPYFPYRSYPWHEQQWFERQGSYSGTIGAASNSSPMMNMSSTMSASASASPASRSIFKTKSIAPKQDSHAEIQTLGTGFGKATDFKTTTVSFSRGEQGGTLIMYYDGAQGLRRRGIILQKKVEQTVPQAFPAMNCQPPPGWKG